MLSRLQLRGRVVLRWLYFDPVSFHLNFGQYSERWFLREVGRGGVFPETESGTNSNRAQNTLGVGLDV